MASEGRTWVACSNCAGDYEDPDRTARTAEEAEDDADSEDYAEMGESPRSFLRTKQGSRD
ncbi:MAG: hypothetical protein JSS69_10120 [Acidobacteria bacterium]|nr:hypothetical protein [Acidobacteriota bacterium]